MALTEIPIELSSTPSIVDGGNATAITIDSSENVGIGTGSPDSYYSKELVVAHGTEGGITLVGAAGTATGYLMFADGTTGDERYRGYVGYSHSTPDVMVFGTAGSERMRIDSSGQVGIGITAPAQTLEIHNSVAGDYTDFGLRGTGHKYVIGVGNDAVATVNDKWYLYDNDNGAFRMLVDTSGDVTMPYKAYAYGTINGNPASITNNYGIALTTTASQNCTPQTNSTHGPGITITKAGFYTLFAQFLYDPGAVYIYGGWAVNGSQIHHWHSNHAVASNHDAVSSIGRYLNVGDHVSIENSNQTISTVYGNAHSSWYIAKIG
jgi:hypothetical protein